ncbi:MAG: flagellar biosynthetic protein FliQ [Polyangiaceae bacterium]
MTSPEPLVRAAVDALALTATVSLPVVGVAAVVGLVVAALQASTQIQDATLAHLPRLVAVTIALVVLGPWMAHHVAAFGTRMFLAAASP